MKIKKLLAGLTAMTALMGTLVSCGTDEEESNSSSETSIKVSEEVMNATEENSEEETTATTEEASESEAETSAVEKETDGEDMTEEKAFELCKEAYKAYATIETGDVSETATDEFFRTNIAVLYYWESEGEIYSEDEIRDVLIENANSNSDFDVDEALNLVVWESAEELDEEALDEWKNSVAETVKKSMDVKDDFDFENIESVWAVSAVEKEEETATEEKENVVWSFDFENPIFYVVKYNGEWKADILTSMMMQLNPLFNIDSEDLTEVTAEENPEEEATDTEETTTETEEASKAE